MTSSGRSGSFSGKFKRQPAAPAVGCTPPPELAATRPTLKSAAATCSARTSPPLSSNRRKGRVKPRPSGKKCSWNRLPPSRHSARSGRKRMSR